MRMFKSAVIVIGACGFLAAAGTLHAKASANVSKTDEIFPHESKQELEILSREGSSPMILSKSEKEKLSLFAEPESSSSHEIAAATAAAVEASSENTTAAIPETETSSFGASVLAMSQGLSMPWLRTALSFAFVSSLIFAIGLLLKNRGRVSTLLSPSVLPLRILQTLPLGFKRNLIVVDFEGQKLLLTSAAHQVQFLYTKPEALSVAREVAAPVAPVMPVLEETEIKASPAEEIVTIPPAVEIQDKVEISDQIRKVVSGLKPMDRKRIH